MDRVQTLDDGTRRLEYHYIPWPLQYPSPLQINAALNEAARRGTALADLHTLDLPHDIAPEERLTDLGEILWSSLPLYATLSFKERPWITWEILLPPGTDAEPDLVGEQRETKFLTRADQFDPLMHAVLPSFPNNRWAMLHFKHLSRHVPAMPDGNPCVMGMAEPLKGPAPDGPDMEGASLAEGWSRDIDLPRVHPMERVEYPDGLFKRLWVSLDDDSIEYAKQWEEREPHIAKVVEGAVAVVPPGGEEFPWTEHYLLRLDLAARIAPRTLEFLRKHRIGHPALWATWRIEPCFRDLDPQVTFQTDPELGGFRAAIVLPKPIFTYNPDLISRMEADIRKQWR